MKILLSKLLYYIGDLISKFLFFDCLSFLYRPYNKIMLLSVRLDKDGKVWKHHPPKLSDKQMDELIEEVKKQKFAKKRKLHE